MTASRPQLIRGPLVGSGGPVEETEVKGPKEVALAYVDRINDGDLEGILEFMPDDYAFVDVDGKVEQGKELMRRGWSGYFSEYPSYKIHLSQVVALGDVVILIGRTTNSQIPSEVEAEETVIWTAWVREGLVKEWRILYADTEKVRRFLGSGHTTHRKEDSPEPSEWRVQPPPRFGVPNLVARAGRRERRRRSTVPPPALQRGAAWPN